MKFWNKSTPGIENPAVSDLQRNWDLSIMSKTFDNFLNAYSLSQNAILLAIFEPESDGASKLVLQHLRLKNLNVRSIKILKKILVLVDLPLKHLVHGVAI